MAGKKKGKMSEKELDDWVDQVVASADQEPAVEPEADAEVEAAKAVDPEQLLAAINNVATPTKKQNRYNDKHKRYCRNPSTKQVARWQALLTDKAGKKKKIVVSIETLEEFNIGKEICRTAETHLKWSQRGVYTKLMLECGWALAPIEGEEQKPAIVRDESISLRKLTKAEVDAAKAAIAA